ncbi:MAG: hypothetical protein GX894_07430 [Clostridia bacterium]|nr:hypothetical protein [Clostridia bacterium]
MRPRAFIFVILALGLVAAGFVFTHHSRAAREKEIMAGFTALMTVEDLTVAEVMAYLDEHIDAVAKEKAATMILRLEEVQRANLTRWQQRYEDEELQESLRQIYGDRWSPQEIIGRAQARVTGENSSELLPELLRETIANGYKVETAEGQYFPVIDYTFYRRYHAAVPREVTAYFELMAVESEEPPAKDAALIIGWDEILRRAANQERFLRTQDAQTRGREAGDGQGNGQGNEEGDGQGAGQGDGQGDREYKSVIIQAARELFKRYLGFALYGCDNTPLFNHWTKEMDPEARQAYTEYLAQAEDGEFSAQIKAYFDVLAANDYRLTPAVDAYRKQVLAAW